MGKKFLSAVLCAALLASLTPAAILNASAADMAGDYNLAEKTSDGVILHAFDWSYNTIKENLPSIAEAGYTSVQTSPVQAPKDYGESMNNTFDQWWKLYQPLSFSIATKNSWLGTKAELTELCEEADKYGIKIICDIVSNHMAGDNSALLAGGINEYEPEIYTNTDKYFHTYRRSVSGDSNIQNIVQGKLNGLPDLNTGDEYIQSRVISLLEECIDCGVDGFRFDAAKHIETPDDGDYSSGFWPNVIGTATSYATEKGVDLYCYGEVLNTPGTNRDITSYTNYLDVTDNRTGDRTLVGVVNKKASDIVDAQGYNYKNASPSDFVLWAESHDTYMGESGSAGLSSTKNVSNEDIAKAWAIVASRSESKALYFARPGVNMDEMADTAWKSTAVSEINKFHNKFIGVSDQVYSDGNIVAVQRGDSGIAIVNLGSSNSISVTTKGMKDGTYTDAVSGNTFTVKSGKLSGTIGNSGIAAIYEGAATNPKINFSVKDKTTFKTDTLKLTVTLENATSGTYSIDGAAPVKFTDSAEITIGEGVKAGSTITVKVTATDGTKTTEETYTYTKIEGNNSGVFVYLDKENSSLTKNWKDIYVYSFYEEKDSNGTVINKTENANWPGVLMDYNNETGLYYYELPKDLHIGEANVIFNNGNGSQTNDLPLTSNNMIFRNNKLIDPNGTTLIYGDIDSNSTIDSSDALSILRTSVKLDTLTDAQTAQADVDSDSKITSNDALLVLRYSVKLNDSNNLTGKEFVFSEGGSNDKDDNKSENVFYIVDGAGWLFSDGCKLWLVNNDTNEAIETIKESPNDDNSKYAYVNLPDGWKNISVYRTKFSDQDISGAYNSWNCGTITDGSNAVKITSDKKSTFTTFDPEA